LSKSPHRIGRAAFQLVFTRACPCSTGCSDFFFFKASFFPEKLPDRTFPLYPPDLPLDRPRPCLIASFFGCAHADLNPSSFQADRQRFCTGPLPFPQDTRCRSDSPPKCLPVRCSPPLFRRTGVPPFPFSLLNGFFRASLFYHCMVFRLCSVNNAFCVFRTSSLLFFSASLFHNPPLFLVFLPFP